MTGLIDLFRSMNRTVLAAGLGLAVAGAAAAPIAFAQDDAEVAAPRHGRGHLRLSAEQRAQIRAIRGEARAERRAMRDQGEQRPAARRHRREMRAEIAQVLTPEQRAAAIELRAERRLARMSERLGLSPSQGQRIAAIHAQARLERATIVERTEARSPERREAMQELRARTRAQVDAVLTAEQRARRGQHRGRGR